MWIYVLKSSTNDNFILRPYLNYIMIRPRGLNIIGPPVKILVNSYLLTRSARYLLTRSARCLNSLRSLLKLAPLVIARFARKGVCESIS